MNIRHVLRGTVIVPTVILTLLVDPFAQGQGPGSVSTGAQDTQSQPMEVVQTPAREVSSTSTVPAAPGPGSTSESSDQVPDSPGAVRAQLLPAAVQENPNAQQPAQSQPQETQQQPHSSPHEPVGTAAAESVSTVGTAASRPAGAALAPAKQRRVRSIIIATGALLGAGAALGVTMALSQASPGRPPGSH